MSLVRVRVYPGSGIGRAIAVGLASKSSGNVLAVARSASLSLDGVSPYITTLDLDISNQENFNTIQHFIGEGVVRSLIYTATSTGSYSGYSNSSYPEFLQHMNIEVAAPFFIIKSLDRNFKPDARILYAFSLCSLEYCLPLPIYSMARAAYFMMFKALRKELKDVHITGV